MSLLLSSRAIGDGWEQIQPGEFAGILGQWYHLIEKRWYPMPISVVGTPCRVSNTWRRPVSWRAQFSAIWTAKGNLFRRYILGRAA